MSWDKQYGNQDRDGSESVWQTSDDGFIITGWGQDTSSSDMGIFLLKTDWKGNKQWIKYYDGGDGYSVKQTSDGGYIATGHKADDLYVLKTDGNGNVQWSKTYAQPQNRPVMGYSVWQVADGYVIGGYADNDQNGWDLYLLKIDIQGNKLWDKSYGGTGTDYCYSIWPTSDGGFILGGTDYSSADSWNPKPCLVKVDANGNQQWYKIYNGGNYENHWGDKCAVQQTRDGGYIYAGQHSSSTYLLKTDASGNQQWTKDYIYGDLYSVQQTWDNGYIMTGYHIDADLNTDNALVIRTDASGNELWQKTYSGVKYAEGASVLQIGNGSYVIAGWTKLTNENIEDIYLFELASDMATVPNAKIVSDSIPAVMEAGKAYSVQVTFENTGTMPWTFQDETTFANSGDAAKFGVTTHQTIQIGKIIRPGQSETFAFTMTAPGENGTYNPRFQMALEGHNAFGALVNKTVTVVNGTGPAVYPPTSTPTVTPTPSVTTPSATPGQATASPVAPTTNGTGIPCLSSLLLPLLAIGIATTGISISKKRGKQ